MKINVFKNIKHDKINSLSILGVATGVICVYIILNIGGVMKESLSSQFIEGSNIVQVQPDFTSEENIKNYVPEITAVDVKDLFNKKYIDSIYINNSMKKTISIGDNNSEVHIEPYKSDLENFFDFDYNKYKENIFKYNAIISSDLLSKFKEQNSVNLVNRKFYITDSFTPKNNILKNTIIIDPDVFENLFTDKYDALTIKINSNYSIKESCDLILSELDMKSKSNEYICEDNQKMKSDLESLVQQLILLLASIGCISVIVSGIGIMNVMYLNINQEKNDICIKRAIGASSYIIMKEYLAKSIILCLKGCVLGISLGIFISYILSEFIGLAFNIYYTNIIFSIVFCTLLGLIFGYAPAIKASSTNIIDFL